MECSAKRLISSAKVVQLLLLDPVLVTVTSQHLSVQDKSVPVDCDIIAARVCGRDKFIVYGTDGCLRLYNVELVELMSKRVGLPGQKTDFAPLMSANVTGDTVAFRNGPDTLSIYSIDSEIKFIGCTTLSDTATSCQVVRGLPGSPGILIIFAGVCASIIEISKTCPVISTLRISHNPVLDVLPLAREGDFLILTHNKARIFALRDILIGRFEVPVVKLPAPLSCASSTRLKDGSISNVAICGGKIWSLEQVGSTLDIEQICRQHPSLNLGLINFFYLIPGAGVRLVHWTTPTDSGRFLLNEDNHFVDLEPDTEVNYSSDSFVIDPPANSLFTFGPNQSGVKALSQCLPLDQLVEPVEMDGVCNIFYEPTFEHLFIVFPSHTSVMSISGQAAGIKLCERVELERQALAIGAVGVSGPDVGTGTCLAVFSDSVAELRLVNDSVEAETTPLSDTVAIAAIEAGRVAYANLNNQIMLYYPASRAAHLLVQAEHQITFLQWAEDSLYYGTTEPSLYCVNISGESTRITLSHKSVPESFVRCGDTSYTSFRDGMVAIDDAGAVSFVRLDSGPLSLRTFKGQVFVYGRGIWLLKGASISRIASVCGNVWDTFRSFCVADVCPIPYFDLSMLVAYNGRVYMLSTTQLAQHTNRPLVKSLIDNKCILSMSMAPSQRLWVAASERELIFFDAKRRTLLSSTTDLRGSEQISAMAVWDIQIGEHTYSHILLATVFQEQHQLRSLSIKREQRNSVQVKKRLKLSVPFQVTAICPIQGGALVAGGTRLELVKVDAVTGLKRESFAKLEGTINQISTFKDNIYLSTTSGLAKFSATGQPLFDEGCMVNRMRECVCHVCCEWGGRGYVVSAEKNCFINIYEITENKRWKLAQRLSSAKRVVCMRQVVAERIDSVVIVALTSSGSFVEIKLGAQQDFGPYLL